MHTALIALFNQIVPLHKEEEDLIRSSFRLKSLAKGEYFLKAGEINQHIGFINQGLVRYFVDKDDEEATFEFTKEGEFIADYQSFSQNKTSIQNIQAIEACTLLVINYPDVQHIFTNTPHGNLLGRIVVEHRFDVMVNQLLSIYMHDPEERYKRFVSAYADIAQRIPQYLIASYVGIKPESLSRMRRRFLKSIS
ncbi:MAG TPA: Crp/Fnr family transcriptional regulator [Bacteroidetes bacterium]|nr:Crp/Fnr family transcriptional regulator [Bacteroidota bacterium]